MKNKFIATILFATLSLLAVTTFSVSTPAQTEPLGGQPPVGAKPSVKDLEEQVAYQRAFEAVVWATPAVAIYRFRAGAFKEFGMSDNDIIAYSKPATPLLEALTANNVTPYITAFTDLRNGPVVLEIPAKTEKNVMYGQIVDAWQVTIADIGPSGEDKGAGGKYLLIGGFQFETAVTIRDGIFVSGRNPNQALSQTGAANCPIQDRQVGPHRISI